MHCSYEKFCITKNISSAAEKHYPGRWATRVEITILPYVWGPDTEPYKRKIINKMGFPDGSADKEFTCNEQDTQEMGFQSLGWNDPLEEEMATHSSMLATTGESLNAAIRTQSNKN